MQLLILIQPILPQPPLQPICYQIHCQITLSKRLLTCEMNRTNKTHIKENNQCPIYMLLKGITKRRGNFFLLLHLFQCVVGKIYKTSGRMPR